MSNQTQNDTVKMITTDDDFSASVCVADPFTDSVVNMEPITFNTEEIQQIEVTSNKVEYKKHETDQIREIENILEHKIHDKCNYYLIKWVGSKIPTWITEEDFIQREALNDFMEYNKLQQNNTITRKAYIYCRTSKRRNDYKEVSLDAQEEYCKQFAKQHNINIIGIIYDNGVSAKTMNNQFGLNHLSNKIKKGECILIYDVSRFSRSTTEALLRLEHLREHIGAIVHSCHDNVTWNNTSTNRATFRQLLSVAQLHSDTVSEKVKSAIAFKRGRGDHIGKVPYGSKVEYINGVKRLIKNDEEQNVIKEIINLIDNIKINKLTLSVDNLTIENNNKYKNKLSIADYKKIAENINKKYRYRNGKLFTWNIVKNIFTKNT